MYLDFSTIKTGEDFELLCEDLLKTIGFAIVSKAARGPDRGRDIIAVQTLIDRAGIQETHRYLIECKHHAVSNKSVREADIGNPISRMSVHNCDRYLLITSTIPSENVQIQLSSIHNTVPSYKAVIWSKVDLRRYLDEYPEVRKRHFNPEIDSKSGLIEEVTSTLEKYLSLPGKSENIKKLLLQNPQIFPIEYWMFFAYEFRTEIQVPEGGVVDCFAARPDSGGIRGYMYYLGSPYDDPFAESGQPGRELESLLTLAHSHASISIQLSSPEHILHPAVIMGQESAGMKKKYFSSRKIQGFGPYAELNIYLIIGQRTDDSDAYDFNRLMSAITWRDNFMKSNALALRGCNVKIEILSYSRLIQVSS
jgi:hypothetical protein